MISFTACGITLVFSSVTLICCNYLPFLVKLRMLLMLIVVLSVREGPTTHVLSLPLLIALVCIVTSGIIVMLSSFVIRRRYSRHKLPMRDRVVSMHTNALYLQDNSAMFDKTMKNNPMYNVTTAPLLAQLAPRISHCPASLSEYEIPLDKKWEFPRASYVKITSVYALCLVVIYYTHYL